MALTVVKRKTSQPGNKNTITTNVVPQILKRNPNLKIVQTVNKNNIVVRTTANNSKLVRTVPATQTISTAQAVPMKRNNTYFNPTTESTPKVPKISGKQFSLQRIASTGTPLTTFDGKVLVQTSTGALKQQQVIRSSGGQPIKIKPGTAVKLEASQIPFIQSNGAFSSGGGGGGGNITTTTTTQFNNNNTVRRPTIYIKGPTVPKKTIRSITLELIEKNPYLHLGVTEDRLTVLQNIICPTINLTRIDLYIALKKLRLNEEFAVLGEYFEYNEIEIQRIFIRTVSKLSKCMKYLVRWPDSKKYYDRHKNLPIPFRSKLSHIQSLVECVETEVRAPLYPQTLEQLHCKNYKFILTISPTGVINFISDAFVGNNHDDLAIFNACNFTGIIPKYLSLVADPGKAIRKKLVDEKPSSTDTALITTEKDDTKDETKIDKTAKTVTTAAAASTPATRSRTNSKRTVSTNSTTATTTTASTITTTTSSSATTTTTSSTPSQQIVKSENVDIMGKPLNSDSDSDSTTDSADEIDEESNMKIIYDSSKQYHINVDKNKSVNNTMTIVNSELTSKKVKDFSIPTLRVKEPVCRLQIQNSIYLLREFKILQPYTVLEPNVYQYINEILVICSALINLQR